MEKRLRKSRGNMWVARPRTVVNGQDLKNVLLLR